MRRIILAGLALAIAVPAAAQTPSRTPDERNGVVRYYDRTGRPEGRSETRGDTTRFYNERGEPRGRAVERNGRFQFYDRTGRPEGRAEAPDHEDRPQTRRR